MMTNYAVSMIYNQLTSSKLIYGLYDWLLLMVRKDCKELKKNDCEDFCAEYEQIKKDLLKKRQAIKNNAKINLLNIDSFERLKIIVETTKEEYKAMSDADEKDMVYFNNLLGWYEAIPSETDMFIDSLFEKQEVIDHVVMCKISGESAKTFNNVNLENEKMYMSGIDIGFSIEDCQAYQEIAMTV